MFKRILLFIPTVVFYVWLTHQLVSEVDPCSATSGGEFFSGLVFWASFPLIAGIVLDWCLQPIVLNKICRYAVVVIWPSVCLLASSKSVLTFLYGIEDYLKDSSVWPWFYEVQCYNEAEPKVLVLALGIAFMFYGFMVVSLFCMSQMKQRLFA